MQADSLTHLVKSQDWWSDYQAHKLREKIFQMEIDNLNNTLNQLPTTSTSASHRQQDIYIQTLKIRVLSFQGLNQLLIRLPI